MDENPELSVFRQRLSQELDSILKTFFVPDMWLFWARKFLYTVHRWRRGGTGGNGRSSGYRKSLRENSSNPLKATCNNVMLKFFLCALFLSFFLSFFLLVYSSFLVSSPYFLPPFFSLFPPAFLLYVFFFPSFCHPLLFLLPSILHFFFLPSLLHNVIPYFPLTFVPSILHSFIPFTFLPSFHFAFIPSFHFKFLPSLVPSFYFTFLPSN